MFNIFKKPSVAVKQAINNAKAHVYPEIVVEIHNEFNTAGEKLLKEAKAILEEAAKANVSKVDRLKALGFGQANEVQKLQPLLEKANLSKEQVDLINYYNQNYPFNKFITEEQVKTICHKYNLICGDVARYRGFVPEKNLREIENFKLKKDDKYTISGYITRADSKSLLNTPIYFKGAEIRENSGFYCIFKKDETDIYNYAFQSDNGINFYARDSKNIFGYAHLGYVWFEVTNKKLQICAPVKDMDIQGMTIADGYKMLKHIPDPVVLCPVNGGYLVMAMWADETFDPHTEPLLINEKLN